MSLKVVVFLTITLLSQGIAAKGKDLVLSMTDLPSSLDQTDIQYAENLFLMQNITEGLLTTGPKGELVNGHADKYEISGNGKRYRFHLKKDIFWSSGIRITARDYVKSWHRLADPKFSSHSKSFLKFVKNFGQIQSGEISVESLGIRAESDTTLTIELEAPTSFFVKLLTLPPLSPVPSYMTDDELDRMFKGEVGLVSSGAFTLESFSGTEVTLAKNPKYWGQKDVFMEKIHFKKSKSFKSSVVNVVSGRSDLAELWDLGEIPWVAANYPEYLKAFPIHGTEYYLINLDNHTLGSNPLLREAMSMSIDRDKISNKIIRMAKPAYNFVPPQMYQEEKQSHPAWFKLSYKERFKKAKSIIRKLESQHGQIPEFSIKVKDVPASYKVAKSLKVTWEAIGLNVKIIKTDSRLVFKDIEKGNYDVARLAWMADYNDPYSFLYLYGKEQKYFGGTRPLKEVDQLLKQALSEQDLKKRESLYVEIENTNHRHNSVLPLYHYQHVYVMAPNLRGIEAGLTSYLLKWAYRS